jgi:hypothetical protein
LQGLAKKLPENFFLVTVLDRVLFPDERIRSHGVKIVKILRAKGPQLDEMAFQSRLEVKRSVHREGRRPPIVTS